MLSQAGQSAELQPEPAGLPLERRNALQARAEHGAQARRNAVPAAVQHEGPGRRNAVPAAVQHEEPGRRNAVPAAVQHEEPGRRNAVPAAVQHEGPGRRNAVPAVQHEEQALGRHEEQERLDGEHCRPSVFQAVLIRSLPPRRLRGLPRRLLL